MAYCTNLNDYSLLSKCSLGGISMQYIC